MKYLLLCLMLLWPVSVQAYEAVPSPSLRLVLQARVTISPAVEVGDSDHGKRRFIPITGGSFTGEGIKGEVLAGGADWQLDRPDGVRELDALYSLRTDDGAVIIVHNKGLSVPDPRYLMTIPAFHAPAGKYEWLNRRVFVGRVSPVPGGGAVIISVFAAEG
ncbi:MULTISPECIES: DUF3237 family protein [unclassified Azospirillum]|uniref:DUF3237 family protein n=1 Tax=unclassified Azospirillum TaxID=2630922 RepID=UPI000B6BEE57|nr:MULTISPECIES: DUF3237 family protein [unclassified Azospirillum]SNS15526.1 Protein of unknown function [Azospirillum sp. RU38E]SNS32801.1 Protein of unknown function [Azospirillum sp. RU37A]